ncbi:MAG TPA: alpha/beta hydrolase [Acidimicrobiia bacterium]|nr:alpha/beta hydrolase [Acidimicrobiia bacterium]
MSYGYLTGVLIFGALVLLTLMAPRRPRLLAGLAYRAASVYNEAPFPFIYLLVISSLGPITDGRLASLAGGIVLGLGLLVILGFGVIAWRGARDRPAVEEALDEGLGIGWRERTDPELIVEVPGRPPIANILLMPFVLRPRQVQRVRNVSYGDAGRHNLLDIYFHRSQPEGAPVLVYFHGGGFYGGRKSIEGRALLFRLARRGWVTISANYRLRPHAGFSEHLVDVKKVVAWVREHGHEYGADPSTLFLSGGSAGGTLSSIAALTQNDPRYQPGFEEAETSVTGVASLYGWYGGYYEMGGAESEFGVLGHDAAGAAPFFIAHGRNDTLAAVETARRFVAHLRSGSPNPVVYVELEHGQHAFDLFHSFRFSAVVDGVEAFASAVRSKG